MEITCEGNDEDAKQKYTFSSKLIVRGESNEGSLRTLSDSNMFI